jgi:hypothetical protein
MKRANASGIQITRTERSGFVHYEIDYQHAGAVRYLPPMQPDEYLNLDAFRPANLKRRRKLLVKRKRKTNGSIRKFAGTRAKKGKRPHFKPDDSKMISLDKLYTKMDTEVAPKKETK